MPTLELFQRCFSCWQVRNKALAGLDYAQVHALMVLLEIDNKKQVFNGLQVMERAIMNDRVDNNA